MARLPPQTTSDRTRPLRRLRTNSNMVAEPEMMYGLASVERRMECAWSVASSGPDESSRVDLVTRVLDVKSAEIRKRLQDAEVKLARSPECAA